MEFYNLNLKRKVEVPDDRLRKQVFQQKASRGGVNQRYALVAEMDGTRMFKFVSAQTYASMPVPEIGDGPRE